MKGLLHKTAVYVAAIAVFLTLAAAAAYASDPVLGSLQSIKDTQYHKLSSQILDRDLHILVRRPDGYEESARKRYPVVYLLDGGATYPMLAGYYRYLKFQEAVPEMIVVAISYASDDFREGNYRSTDYTAPTEQREYWGGAAAFQQVLEQELLPLIESTYRADAKRRIIFGQSIGGQFVLYTALTRPDLFWGHIASNPALHRNLDFFLQPQSEQKRSASRLFVASAAQDERRFRRPAVAWIDHWTSVPKPPWKLSAVSVEGYGHFSLVTESFRRGLLWLFD